MTDDPDCFEKCTNLKRLLENYRILLYQSSLERKNFMKLKDAQLFYLVIKLTKLLTLPEGLYKMKKEESYRYHIVLLLYFSY